MAVCAATNEASTDASMKKISSASAETTLRAKVPRSSDDWECNAPSRSVFTVEKDTGVSEYCQSSNYMLK